MAAEAGEQLARCLLTELKTARFRVPAENGTNPGHRLRFFRAEIRFGGVPLAGQLHQPSLAGFRERLTSDLGS